MTRSVCTRSFCTSVGALFAAMLVIPLILVSCGQVDNSAKIETHKKLAAELRDNSLYAAAIDEYDEVLGFGDLTDEQRANICYLIGRVYFEDVGDYQHAAAYFIRAREYDPNGSFVTQASKNLVASLEKLGNVLDARRQLGAVANLDGQPAGPDDKVVAIVGDQEIYLSEIESQIELLPVSAQERLVNREAKLEFVHQYVGMELLYHAAVREDYLSDPSIQREQEQLARRLLVEKFVAEKVMPSVKIDSIDVSTYYEANKDGKYGGEPYDSVRQKVLRDYQSVKADAAYGEYISRLAAADKVQFLDQNVK